MNKNKIKIPPRKVSSDDCVIYVGRVIDAERETITEEGTPYYIHKGEWVKIIPLLSVRDYLAWNKLRGAFAGDEDRMEAALDELCRGLSNKITEWNWTDMAGEQLPQPYKNPDVIKELNEMELIWLSTALVETGGQRKNDSAPSV